MTLNGVISTLHHKTVVSVSSIKCSREGSITKYVNHVILYCNKQ